MKLVKKYPIIGGPLDGKFANLADWYSASTWHPDPNRHTPTGQFHAWKDEYVRFNAGERHAKAPSMVYLWAHLLRTEVKLPQ